MAKSKKKQGKGALLLVLVNVFRTLNLVLRSAVLLGFGVLAWLITQEFFGQKTLLHEALDYVQSDDHMVIPLWLAVFVFMLFILWVANISRKRLYQRVEALKKRFDPEQPPPTEGSAEAGEAT